MADLTIVQMLKIRLGSEKIKRAKCTNTLQPGVSLTLT